MAQFGPDDESQKPDLKLAIYSRQYRQLAHQYARLHLRSPTLPAANCLHHRGCSIQ